MENIIDTEEVVKSLSESFHRHREGLSDCLYLHNEQKNRRPKKRAAATNTLRNFNQDEQKAGIEMAAESYIEIDKAIETSRFETFARLTYQIVER